MSLNVLRAGVPLAASLILAACGSGGNALPAAKATPTPTPAPLAASASLQLLGGSRTTAADSRSENNNDTSDGSRGSAADAALRFACPTSPSQTIAVTHSHDGELGNITISKNGIVTLAVAKSNRERRHRRADSDSRDERSARLIVSPVGAGSTSIFVRSDDDENRGMAIDVTVGTCGTPAPAPSPSPLPPVATFTGALLDCTNPSLACGRSGSPVIGGTLKGVLVPRDAMSISEPGYAGTFTIASLDGNCGIDGLVGPETIAATTPVTTVYAGLSYKGFTTAGAGTKIGDIKDVPCAFSIADQNGGKTTASFVYRLKFPL